MQCLIYWFTINNMTTTTKIKSATEYRALSARAHQRSLDSWERSDSDGFLSQWANDQMESIYIGNAHVVEAGFATAWVLMDLNDNIVAVREGSNDYGTFFILEDAAVERGLSRFITESGAENETRRVANNAKKGVKTAWVKTTAMCEDRRGVVIADGDAILAGDYEVIGYTRWID